MTGDDLPADAQIVRYVKPSMIQEDGTADGSEFRLRPNRPDENALSVNWLDAFASGQVHGLAEIRRVSRLKLRPNGRFAEMNVGEVKKRVAEELNGIRIVHDPLAAEDDFEPDPSHSEIIGLPPGDSDQAMLVGDLIAKCITTMHPAI